MTDAERDQRVARAKQLLHADPQLSRRAAAKQVGLPESTLRGRLDSPGDTSYTTNGPDAPGVETNPDGTTTFTTNPDDVFMTTDEAIEAVGEKPDDWEVIAIRVNNWGGPNATDHRQLRVSAVPIASLLRVPDPAAWTPPPPPQPPEFGDRSLVICGDHHCPHHDKGLHSAFLAYLDAEQPDEGILLGDMADYSDISQHRTDKEFAQNVNETNDAVVQVLQDYRNASPNTKWTLLRGNHDDRIEYALMDYKPELYGVRPGELDGNLEIPALSLRRLWHLDELGIDLVDREWKRGKFAITPSLTARHGYMTSNNTANTMLNKHTSSQVQGHIHRLQIIYRTKHDPIDVKLAAQAGTMAEIKDGLGYTDEPDWQQGCIVGYAWEDGDFALAPAPYIRGRLLLPDGRRFRS